MKKNVRIFPSAILEQCQIFSQLVLHEKSAFCLETSEIRFHDGVELIIRLRDSLIHLANDLIQQFLKSLIMIIEYILCMYICHGNVTKIVYIDAIHMLLCGENKHGKRFCIQLHTMPMMTMQTTTQLVATTNKKLIVKKKYIPSIERSRQQ